MVLKDWKQVKDGWRGNKERIHFNVYFGHPKYEVGIRKNYSASFHTKRLFNVKSRALKFVIQYMNTH